MLIETQKAIYDVAISVAQIEITSRCNMNCIHCRGNDSKKQANHNLDMPFEAVKKVIDFAKENSENGFVEIVLSGGEPLMHPDLEKMLDYCSYLGVLKEITTNGSLIDDVYIEKLKKYDITNVSVSIDSFNADMHDYIRQCPGAFDKAMSSITKMISNGINTRIRSSISKRNFNEMEDIVLRAIDMGLSCVAFGPVIPVGNAINLKDEIFINSEEMKQFIDKFFNLKQKYSGVIDIITNECLHGIHYFENNMKEDEDNIELNGCTAGIGTFNVLLNGDITPCSMFHKRMANIFEDVDLKKAYTESPILHELLDRNYKGKCGRCDKKYICGGCRVRSEYFYQDYLNEDPLCWVKL